MNNTVGVKLTGVILNPSDGVHEAENEDIHTRPNNLGMEPSHVPVAEKKVDIQQGHQSQTTVATTTRSYWTKFKEGLMKVKTWLTTAPDGLSPGKKFAIGLGKLLLGALGTLVGIGLGFAFIAVVVLAALCVGLFALAAAVVTLLGAPQVGLPLLGAGGALALAILASPGWLFGAGVVTMGCSLKIMRDAVKEAFAPPPEVPQPAA